jgi:hypothetical protein
LDKEESIGIRITGSWKRKDTTKNFKYNIKINIFTIQHKTTVQSRNKRNNALPHLGAWPNELKRGKRAQTQAHMHVAHDMVDQNLSQSVNLLMQN